ncbi:MAG: hypothetical protein ACRDEA_05125 [Microcystaceae cyanobacterium]
MNIKRQALWPLRSPTPSKPLKTTPTDRRFHQLIKQSLLGLPLEKLLEDQPQYQLWFKQVQSEAPSIWTLPTNQKATDYTINYCDKDVRLCSTYDLLLVETEKAEIIRWTTAASMPLSDLIGHPSTQLDLFLLRQTFEYPPEQISLSYWFLSQEQAIKVSIPYSRQLHQYLSQQLPQLLHDSGLNSSPTGWDEESSLTSRFLKGELSATQYLDAIPEVEI